MKSRLAIAAYLLSIRGGAFTTAFMGCSFLLLSTSFASADDASVRAAFLREYKDHAQSLERYYTNIRVKFVQTDSSPQSGGGWMGTGEAKYNRSNFVVSGDTVATIQGKPKVGGSHDRSVEGRNSNYYFILRPLPDEKYLLERLTLFRENGPMALCFLSAPFADWSMKYTFLEMGEANECEFLDFKDVVWQNKPMKELKVRFVVGGSDGKKKTEITASYYLSPQDAWVCCGKRYHVSNEPVTKYLEEIYFYGPKKGKEFGVLIRVESWRRDEQLPMKFSYSRVTEMVEVEHCPPFPDADFTLSASGLPEPMGVPKPAAPIRWYLWLSIGAFVCLLLAVVCWRITRAKRQQTTATALPPT